MQVPATWTWLTWSLVSALAIAVLLAPGITYHRTATVRGWVVPDRGATRLVAQQTGRVESLAARNGASVVEGDVLVTLSADRAVGNGTSYLLAGASSIADELSEIVKQGRLVSGRQDADIRSAERRMSRLDDEVRLLAQQQQAQSRRLAVAIEKLRRLRDANDAVPEWQVLEQSDEVDLRRATLQQLQQTQLELVRERDSAAELVANLPVLTEMQLSALREREARLQRELLVLESATKVPITAPVSGTVADVAIAEGDPVTPGRTLVTVIPEGSRLQVELFVPSSAAGSVEARQRVRLAFDAFPRHKFGTTEGTTLAVAQFVTLPAEVPPAVRLREAGYRVTAEIGQTALPLRAGMTLGAELILEERTVVDWLLEPLLSRGG